MSQYPKLVQIVRLEGEYAVVIVLRHEFDFESYENHLHTDGFHYPSFRVPAHDMPFGIEPNMRLTAFINDAKLPGDVEFQDWCLFR